MAEELDYEEVAMNKKVMPTRAAARRLGVSESTVTRLCRKRQLQGAQKVNRAWQISKKAVDSCARRRKRTRKKKSDTRRPSLWYQRVSRLAGSVFFSVVVPLILSRFGIDAWNVKLISIIVAVTLVIPCWPNHSPNA